MGNIKTALDLYCGGGGATIGLMQAGFEVTGIDIKPRSVRDCKPLIQASWKNKRDSWESGGTGFNRVEKRNRWAFRDDSASTERKGSVVKALVDVFTFSP